MSTALEPETKTQLLTFSRSDAFKTCRRKSWFAYELGIRRDVDAKALRMGSAGHAGLEVLGKGGTIEQALDPIYALYANTPATIDEYEWRIEEQTVITLVCGYQWRWQDAGLEYLATEQSFELPLLNPETGRPTPNFNLAGKIDGIVKLHDGRLAVKESKFLGEDISPDSPMWQMHRRSPQVSIYVIAARRLGYPVDCVLYDVLRKPSIKPTEIPELDQNKQKIVLDANRERVYTKTGAPRQTGSTSDGWYVQSRPMTIQEWGEKLNSDIGERPEFYFQRVEIARMDDDLRETEEELWDLQKTIRDAQLTGRWYRTVNRNTCQYCPFDAICDRSDFTDLPEGFVRVQDIHPELERA